LSSARSTLARTDTGPAALLALAAFVVYAFGACRTIYVGDSGELVAAMHTLGIPHPSGYPLYVLLGKLWTVLVPVGSVAFRMSLFSSFFAALAVGLLLLAGRALGAGRAAAATAAIVFAASPSFWGEANVQRVYALNACFVALATLLAVRWWKAAPVRGTDSEIGSDRSFHGMDRRFVVVALVCGIGAANHTFLAVWGAVFLVWAATVERRLLRRFWTLLAGAAAALAGLSLYGFLLVRSRQDPRLDWGDPETPGALWAVVTRRDFWPRRWWSGWADLWPIARDFFSSFAVELTVLGVVLVVAGAVVALRRRLAPVGLLGLVALANLAVMAAHGSRSDLFLWHRYYLPAYLSAALVGAVGLDATLRALASRSGRLASAAGAAAVAAAVVLVPLRFRGFDRSRYRIAESYSRTLLASLPPGAHLAASDDNILFVLIYLQLVEGVRPDVDLILQGVGGELPPLRFDPDREPLFFTHHPNWRHPELEVLPAGLAYRVARAGAAPPALPAIVESLRRLEGEDDPRVPKDYLTRNLIGELHFMLGVTWESRDPERALAELAEAARAAPDNDVLHYNLGLVYERMGLPERALAAYERSRAINPREIPGPSRARAADRIEALRRRSSRRPGKSPGVEPAGAAPSDRPGE
jgi:tetratricopeptide (TPR) repeat protein